MQRVYSLLHILILFSVGSVYGQLFKGPVNAYTHVLVDASQPSALTLISQGARAFTIHNFGSFNRLNNSCNEFLLKQEAVFYLLADTMLSKTDLNRLCTKLGKRAYLADNALWPTEKQLLNDKQNYVIITQNKLQVISDTEIAFRGKTDFIQLNLSDTNRLYSKLYNYWERNAHPVNFISAPLSVFEPLKAITDRLNTVSRISGRIESDGKPLRGVSFNNSPLTLANDKFCYPFALKIKLQPQKYGYEFVPDIISAYYTTEYHYVNIEAVPMSLTKRMMVDIRPGIEDGGMKPEAENFKTYGISVSKQGNEKSLRFSTSSYMVFDPVNQKDSLLNLTLSCRIKFDPDVRFHTIVSQGANFIIKVFDKHMCLTLPERKDYRLNKFTITPNVWYNLTFSVEKGKFVCLYNDSKLVDSCTIEKTMMKSDRIMIGNSLYEEHFCGELQYLNLWSRVLGQHEMEQYWKREHEVSYGKWFWELSIILLPVLFLLGVKYLYRKRSQQKPPHVIPLSVMSRVESAITGVKLFGSLSIINDQGEELTTDMFPKVRQMFVLMVLNTFEKDGVSTSELNDCIWPGMNELSAKNNRGVTVQNLRQALTRFPQLKVSFSEKKWRIEGLESIYVDYKQCLELLEKLEKDYSNRLQVTNFLTLVSDAFLKNMQTEFVDHYKSKLNERILAFLFGINHYWSEKNDAEILLKLSEAIFCIDEVNEEALRIRIKAYQLQKNDAMIRISKDNFCAKHLAIYGETYLGN